MPSLFSHAVIRLPDSSAVAEAFVADLARHDVPCERAGARVSVTLGLGACVMDPTGEALKVRLRADDEASLEMLRAFVAERVVELAGAPEPVIIWRGAAAGGDRLAGFREARLVSSIDLTPRMRRLTFAGEGVGQIARASELHVRMFFPPEGDGAPEWPRPGADGRIVWPAADRRPAARYYTVRRAGRRPDEIEIDFLIHDDPGPGCVFARSARPGALCGLTGPVGRPAPAADWTLLAGDETALPAIARMLEEMPADAAGAALIEVEDASDEIPLDRPRGVTVAWVRRSETRGLAEAVRELSFPDPARAYAWAACEHACATAIRDHLRAERGMPRDRHAVVGYWERDSRNTA